MDTKLAKVYYSPRGYWKGIAAIKKLSEAAKVSEDTAKKWLVKQALWQIYLPAPQRIPRPKFDVPTPNAVHQADLLKCPQMLQVDPGHEFMGAVTKEMENHKTLIRRGRIEIH